MDIENSYFLSRYEVIHQNGNMAFFVETRSALGNQVLGCPTIYMQSVNQYYLELQSKYHSIQNNYFSKYVLRYFPIPPVR